MAIDGNIVGLVQCRDNPVRIVLQHDNFGAARCRLMAACSKKLEQGRGIRAHLLCSTEKIVDKPVQRQSRGYIQGEVTCTTTPVRIAGRCQLKSGFHTVDSTCSQAALQQQHILPGNAELHICAKE